MIIVRFLLRSQSDWRQRHILATFGTKRQSTTVVTDAIRHLHANGPRLRRNRCPRTPEDRPESGPRAPQRNPRAPPREPKIAQERAQERPREPKSGKITPQSALEAPRKRPGSANN